MATKPEKRQAFAEIEYNNNRWQRLNHLRQKTLKLIEVLEEGNIEAIVHGSIARGDVRKDSDIDLFILNPPSSFQIETTLERARISVTGRTIIQATPNYAMKGYIEIGEAVQVSFPLMSLRSVEREFYRFSGEIGNSELRSNVRVSGVDKRLMLIEPTGTGHRESSIIGKEEQTAKLLGIAVQTVLDRVRALTRRDVVGRTGVFLKVKLPPDETFEMALNRIAAENPAVRRRLKS
jgi:predicted nucleotidyltransferase